MIAQASWNFLYSAELIAEYKGPLPWRAKTSVWRSLKSSCFIVSLFCALIGAVLDRRPDPLVHDKEWLRHMYYIHTILSYPAASKNHIPGDDTVPSPKATLLTRQLVPIPEEQAPEGLLITKSLVKSDDTEDVEHSANDDRSEECNTNWFYYGVYMPE